MLKLILAYYLKEEPDLILFDENSGEIDWDDDDLEGYYESNLIKIDLYSLKLDVLIDYYGDKYRNEIVDNQEEYEKFFDTNFVYNFFVLKI